jgi:hypothetical protein
MRCIAPFTIACALTAAGTFHIAAAENNAELLDRATAYVSRFIDAFSNVVAEEVYVQQLKGHPKQTRTLRSDFLLVRYPASAEWYVFRVVNGVDGQPVRDVRDGLVDLFRRPAPDALRRAQELAALSTQHNLEDVGTVNNPLLAISILQQKYRARFRFRVKGVEPSLGESVHAVQFEEVDRPTILRLGRDQDLPSSGTLWIDGPSGRVVKTELRLGRRHPAMIATRFGTDQALGIDVPLEMRDSYPLPGQGAPGYTGSATGSPGTELSRVRGLEDRRLEGVATYSLFRRFQVTTEERLGR